jgi:hypothetical protein
MAAKKRTAKETWDAIIRDAEKAEIDEALAETPEQVDEGLRRAGMDPAKVREKGKNLAARLLEERERLSWMVDAARARAREEARAKGREGRYAGLSRPELLARLAATKNDPRLTKPVAFMFRNHAPETATEAQLRGMLEDLDALAEMEDEINKGGSGGGGGHDA